MKTTVIERKEFASVAEAIAYYYALGFDTFDDGSEDRIMRHKHEDEEVRITHPSLLLAVATRIRINT